MLVLSGRYHFGTKQIACRADRCDFCKEVALTEQFRSIVVLHVFFIPLLPLGWTSEWRCTCCGKDPTGSRPSSAVLVSIGVVICSLMLGLSFLPGFARGAGEEIWQMRAVALAFIAVLVWTLVFQKREAYRVAKTDVQPLARDRCPYCPDAHVLVPTSTCPECGIRIL